MAKPKNRTSTTQERLAPPEPIATYLQAVSNPENLKDVDAIGEIEDRLAQDGLDPAEKLELLLRRRTLNQVDIGPLETAFVKAVPDYLAQFDLDLTQVREDFLAVGVPAEVLDQVASHGGNIKVGTVSFEGVRSYALSRDTPFTQQDLMEATGASRGTVAKVVKSLVEDKKVSVEKGRPIIYTVR
jgi:CRP-like cAMP-binding protein